MQIRFLFCLLVTYLVYGYKLPSAITVCNRLLSLRGGGVDETVTEVTDLHHFESLLGKCEDGKLAVVDFSASWCPPCKMIAPVYEDLSKKHTDCLFLKVRLYSIHFLLF